MKTKDEKLNAFLLATNANNIKYKDLSAICNRPESTVFKWLNKTLIPDDASVMLLYLAIRSARLEIPRELSRVYSSLVYFPYRWAKKNRSTSDSPKFTGTVKKVKKYIFEGEEASIPEIASKTGFSYITVYSRIKKEGLKEKTDVTKNIKSIKIRKRIITE